MKFASRILFLLFLATIAFPLSGYGVYGYFEPDTLISVGIKVDTFNLKIIPPSSGVQFYQDGILYLSSAKSTGRMPAEHISFGSTNAMVADLRDGILENERIFSNSRPFTFPAEAVTFSGDFKTMYFTRYSDNDEMEKIFKATLSEQGNNEAEWIMEENPVSFCTERSIYTHPALSADGKMMIFSSNCSGTAGGMDLFITQDEDGKWSEPKNLGDAINSASDEMFPFLDKDNNLFFSSKGFLGYGGYDIYVCKFKGNTWESPVNLSVPINTVFDDVAFSIDKKDGKSAFYTLKEKSGKRSVNLIKVSFTSNNDNDEIQTLSQFLTNPVARNVVTFVTEPAVEATDRRAAAERPRGRNDNIVYRVQVLTSFNPKTRSIINLDGIDYSVYEYLYSGAYRLCAGEFSTIAPAIALRNKFIQNDYPQATVVVFRNNVRSFDPELLTEPSVAPAAVPVQETKKPITDQPLIQAPETRQAEPVKEPVAVKTEPAKAPVTGSEIRKEPAANVPAQALSEKKDMIIYRVQIATNTTAKGSYKLTVGNKTYDTYEYKYAGAYRTCIGEFNNLASASELQNIARKNGYPQAFVVVFRDNVRSTDPALFR